MSSGDDPLLAATLAMVAQALAVEGELTGVLLRTCHLAVENVDGCEHADVMIVAPGGALTVPAATDWVGTRVVSFEDEYGEGPCVDAFRRGTLVDAPDLTAETRWPRFTPRCVAETPVRSAIGLPLLVGDRPVGVLDMYATGAHAFSDEDQAAGALFAAHAAVAVAAAKERVELQTAIANRDVIGQAKGILMAQSHITADEAFDLLRRASQRLNEKLVAVAQELVDRTELANEDG